jgi:hypothetical protein
MKRIWKRSLRCLAMIQVASLSLSAQTTSPILAPKVVLVELFTSEGCFSCPPADALLREVNGTVTNSGQLIVGISEHVTYWNSIGWADPFSSALFTDRQNAYGSHFGLNSVYTPQMIVNGTEQIVGSDRPGLMLALKRDVAKPAQVALHILSMKVTGDGLVAKFSMTSAMPLKGDIVAVLADDFDRSSVSRGENSGRNLSHVAVARTLSRVAMQSVAEQEIHLPLPASFQAAQKHHLILFAQAPSYGRVLGVDTSSIPQLE